MDGKVLALQPLMVRPIVLVQLVVMGQVVSVVYKFDISLNSLARYVVLLYLSAELVVVFDLVLGRTELGV